MSKDGDGYRVKPGMTEKARYDEEIEIVEGEDKWEYEAEVRLVRNLSECRKVSEEEKFPVYVMDIPN